tara:strand:+ start:834 stop:1040 length:207 start_codon:yes stop_codon:yes gene_type:complete
LKAQFARFPEAKGGNNKNNNLYTKEYRNMRVDARDMKAALTSSDNGRCWWIYNFLSAYPFRIEHTKQT